MRRPATAGPGPGRCGGARGRLDRRVGDAGTRYLMPRLHRGPAVVRQAGRRGGLTDTEVSPPASSARRTTPAAMGPPPAGPGPCRGPSSRPAGARSPPRPGDGRPAGPARSRTTPPGPPRPPRCATRTVGPDDAHGRRFPPHPGVRRRSPPKNPAQIGGRDGEPPYRGPSGQDLDRPPTTSSSCSEVPSARVTGRSRREPLEVARTTASVGTSRDRFPQRRWPGPRRATISSTRFATDFGDGSVDHLERGQTRARGRHAVVIGPLVGSHGLLRGDGASRPTSLRRGCPDSGACPEMSQGQDSGGQPMVGSRHPAGETRRPRSGCPAVIGPPTRLYLDHGDGGRSGTPSDRAGGPKTFR